MSVGVLGELHMNVQAVLVALHPLYNCNDNEYEAALTSHFLFSFGIIPDRSDEYERTLRCAMNMSSDLTLPGPCAECRTGRETN